MESQTVSCICWVPRGAAASHPRRNMAVAEEMRRMRQQHQQTEKKRRIRTGAGKKKQKEKESAAAQVMEDDEAEKLIAPTAADSDEDESEEECIAQNSDFDMDDYDNEPDTGEQFFSVFDSGAATAFAHDPNLRPNAGGDSDEDSDEEDATQLRATDRLFVAATAEEDTSTLEVYVYDEPSAAMYVHHDILIGGYPLALEWMNCCDKAESKNVVALGSFDSSISIWDLDVLDGLEPASILQGVKEPKTKKAAKKAASSSVAKAPSGGHAGPVMALHRSPHKHQILASASADETVRVWDVATGVCAHTYTQHTDKVQSVRWHPSEVAALLSASYDRTAALVDVRAPQATVYAPLTADAESALWSRHQAWTCMVGDSPPFIHCCAEDYLRFAGHWTFHN
eukprot:GHVT01078725.1.p1 GENE.GHVT01078725.1~~GHVT01078725.1.p1  ORF type:complete len:397 (+),score=99.62 GHVT01078725.1:174-1364(+)